MTATQIKKYIEEQLSPEGLAYWNGCDPVGINEWVILAQQTTADFAVSEIEECAKCEC
jgi:hypothetical protein